MSFEISDYVDVKVTVRMRHCYFRCQSLQSNHNEFTVKIAGCVTVRSHGYIGRNDSVLWPFRSADLTPMNFSFGVLSKTLLTLYANASIATMTI